MNFVHTVIALEMKRVPQIMLPWFSNDCHASGSTLKYWYNSCNQRCYHKAPTFVKALGGRHLAQIHYREQQLTPLLRFEIERFNFYHAVVDVVENLQHLSIQCEEK